MVVEQEALAEQPPKQSQQPIGLRRVAGVQHVEPTPE
jgi:hypothetical protein